MPALLLAPPVPKEDPTAECSPRTTRDTSSPILGSSAPRLLDADGADWTEVARVLRSTLQSYPAVFAMS